jgi:cyclophilin family peptidyl-prolyl cis-trans isomerase
MESSSLTHLPLAIKIISADVVFGKILEGVDFIKTVESVGTNSGAPKSKVTIVDSGELA